MRSYQYLRPYLYRLRWRFSWHFYFHFCSGCDCDFFCKECTARILVIYNLMPQKTSQKRNNKRMSRASKCYLPLLSRLSLSRSLPPRSLLRFGERLRSRFLLFPRERERDLDRLRFLLLCFLSDLWCLLCFLFRSRDLDRDFLFSRSFLSSFFSLRSRSRSLSRSLSLFLSLSLSLPLSRSLPVPLSSLSRERSSSAGPLSSTTFLNCFNGASPVRNSKLTKLP